MSRKFYRTTISIDVLSEQPIGDCYSLSQLDVAITEGDLVGGNLRTVETELTPKEMADALYAVGSEPGFFMLDNNGNYCDYN